MTPAGILSTQVSILTFGTLVAVRPPPPPGSGELRTQKLKSHAMRTPGLKVFLLKPWVGQYIAMHATFTARDFFLTNFYPSGPFTCIFSRNLSRVFPVLAVTNTGPCVGPRNKLGPRSPCWMQVPVLSVCGIFGLQDMCYCFSGFVFRNCGYDLSCGLIKTDLWYNVL